MRPDDAGFSSFAVITLTGNAKIHGKRKNSQVPGLCDFQNFNNQRHGTSLVLQYDIGPIQPDRI